MKPVHQHAEAIARWAENRPASPAGLSRAEEWQIVTASERAGMTLPTLAAEFGREELVIARVLADWTDTRPAAKKLLHAQALRAADRLLTDAEPSVLLELLERIDVVDPPKGRGGAEGITIIVGGGPNDVHIVEQRAERATRIPLAALPGELVTRDAVGDDDE